MNGRDESIVCKILDYCNEVEVSHRFFHDDKNLFCDRERGIVYRNAISMPVLQIGELVKNLSENFRCTHSAIPWRSVARMRDLLAHRYGVLDYEQMWDTSHDSVAKLKQYLLDMNRKTPLEL
ncbi:MAG: DUF86 domain-containing protein [Deltaproteobacteria bacterium]|jgi:uncharacterized protein with HEPN domain|nr:DUF86 domain-containing protein [Deltaproteobacteria bacterium]